MKIEIIGRGNVATHLHRAFQEKGIDIYTVNPHTLERFTGNADITLIAVKDNFISATADKIKGVSGIVAHTSGSVDIAGLRGCAKHTGVFYPAQTFTKSIDMQYADIPFFIEGSDPETEKVLISTAEIISSHVDKADSHQRRILHIASVLACNFTNHLWYLAEKILKSENFQFDTIRPLIRQTTDKAMSASPYDVQTGPASRGDTKVIDDHLSELKTDPGLKNIYKLLSESILKTYHNECH